MISDVAFPYFINIRKLIRKGNLTNLSKKFIKWAKHGIFVFSNDKYSTNLTTNDKSVDGVLVTQTQVI